MSYQPIPSTFKDEGSRNVFTSVDNAQVGGESGTSVVSILTSDLPVHTKAIAVGQHLKACASVLYGQCRPWSEFFDRAYFCSPEGVSDAISRFMANTRYFYPNYFLLSLLCSSYVLLINLTFSLCILVAMLFYYYIQSEAAALASRGNYLGRITIAGKSFSTVQLYIGLSVFSLLSFYYTNGSSVVFWLLVTTLGVVSPHATCRRPALSDPSFQFA